MSEAALTARERVALTLSGRDPVLGRSVAFGLQALIVISILSLAIETLPGLPGWIYDTLRIEEYIIVTLFTIEYGLRIWSAERPWRYIFSFWGLIDLGAILPSILLAGTDMRSMRIFRMMRLLRLLKLMRYSKASDRLYSAFRSVRAELVVVLILSFMMLYICAAGIYFFEHKAQPESFASIPHSLWWAVATLTTVGYGDVYPITTGGRIFTGFVLFVGLGIVAVPTGLIATALASAHAEEDTDEDADDRDLP